MPALKPIPGAGLCAPELIREAIQKAGACASALPYVPPVQRWDDLPPLRPEQRERAYSLVKGTKSPTNAKARELFEVDTAFLAARHDRMLLTGEIDEVQTSAHEHQREQVAHGTPSAFCIVERRIWADEFRVRTQVDATTKALPPEQSGPRITQYLSDRGLTALTDSAAYVSATKPGFTTFVTLTFTDEARQRLESGDTSIQREARRCFDAWTKMYRRGMKRQGIAGNTDSLDYLWVVEVPDNKAGEPNPHLHVLMRWQVEYSKFQAWAARLEAAWGQGFAHIEKIKNGAGAGAYISKAVGYLCKAQGKSDQGTVRGNRYGISASARAPGWQTLTKTQIDCMSQLIADVYDHLTVKHGQDYKARQRLNREKQGQNEKIRAYKAKAGLKKAPDWMTRQRKKIEERLEAVRERLNALPCRVNRYQIILKGGAAYVDFMAWASNPGFKSSLAPWLPVKPAGVAFEPGKPPKADRRHYFVELRAKFQRLKVYRQAVTDEVNAMITEHKQQLHDAAMSMQSWAVYQYHAGAGALGEQF